MKEINVWLILAFVSFLLLAPSCSKEASQHADFSIKNASQLIDQFNAGKLEMNHGEYFEGKVFMRSATNNMLVIFVQSDKLDDHTLIYQLQTKGLQSQHFTKSVKNAQILYTRENLIVNSTTTPENYLFTIAADKDIVKLDNYNSSFNGFGLSRAMIETSTLGNSNIERSELQDFGNGGDPPPVEGCICLIASGLADGCNSGGLGSTGCGGNYGPNGQPCQVNCSVDDGYHACCHPE